MAGVRPPIAVRVKAEADKRREAKAPKAGFDNLLADALLAEGTPTGLREQLAYQPEYGSRDNIVDRRAENVPPANRSEFMAALPATPEEMRKYQLRLHEVENYKRRLADQPEAPLPQHLAPARVQPAVDDIEAALTRLRSKLGS